MSEYRPTVDQMLADAQADLVKHQRMIEQGARDMSIVYAMCEHLSLVVFSGVIRMRFVRLCVGRLMIRVLSRVLFGISLILVGLLILHILFASIM